MTEPFEELPDAWLPEAAEHLTQHWGIAPEAVAHASDWEIVLHALPQRVAVLLRDRPEKLTSAMYLLDISEKAFAAALEQPTHEDRAHALATAILERETQKIRTRHAYARKNLE